jgi:hypothetical protein
MGNEVEMRKTRNKNRRGKNRAHTKDEKYEREENEE